MSGVILAISRPRTVAAGGGGAVAITNQVITKIGTGASSATANIAYKSSGTVLDNMGAVRENWLITGVGADYDIRATLQSGTNPTTGTMGTWLNLGTSRTWQNTAIAGTNLSSVFLIEIRNATTLVVLDSATIDIEVQNGG